MLSALAWTTRVETAREIVSVLKTRESIDQLNYGRVLLFFSDHSGKRPSRLNPEMNIARYLSGPVFITDSPILQRGCPGDLSGTGAIEHLL